MKAKIVFSDKASLIKATQDLGWEWVEGKTTYEWFQRHVGDYPLPEGINRSDLGKCSHVIRVPGAKYEIGVIQQADGTLLPIWDFYQPGGLYDKMGDHGSPLKGAYAAAAAKAALGRKGFRVVEDRVVDGKRQIRFARAVQS